ncbi:ABC transporter ATP-binding protein [Tepiditoga spiralis]|uniref:ABC transporter ATP-binding protein n=1 Tax=Tepiditoga spiralis TaxID=2108365 RepID=A0A7G1G8H7_9BACT|nr:ABC transporter ATP-binding protein [Tepiditoga spiralis]BBE31534.1 ABC transporter ATP-binding protein [Tepiditoga spiralis]
MLNIKDITVKFGGLKALENLSFTIQKNTIHSLIGPNGAGKTTLFNVITRIIKPNKGNILFNNESLLNLKSNEIIYKGITRTFQNLQLFNYMNVYENILSGYVHTFNKNSFNDKKLKLKAYDVILEISELLQIKNRLFSYPYQLSYGILKRVEIARAIVSKPSLILFDEPAAGLNNQETSEILSILNLLKSKGKTILLVEHDMSLVMKVSDEITVINFGKKIAEGAPNEISLNEEVINVYLGGGKNVKKNIRNK